MAVRRRYAVALARRLVLFAVLWWVLAEGRLDAPLLALAIVFAATVASLVLKSPSTVRWRPLALAPLAAWFIVQSVEGGLDVARRALAPSLPIQPALLRIELALPGGFPIVLFAWLVSLMPGSAAVHVEGRTLTIHVLDVRMPVERSVRELERRVGLLFGSARAAT